MPYFRRTLSPQTDVPTGSERLVSISVGLIKGILAQESGDLPTHRKDLWAASDSPQTPAPFSIGRIGQAFPLIRAKMETPPGSAAQFRLALVNDEAYPVTCSLFVSEFISDSGCRVPAGAASFQPNPLSLPANSSIDVSCSVQLPAAVLRGSYYALLIAAPAESIPAILHLEVNDSNG